MRRIEVKPELLRWARERAGRSMASLRRRFPKIDQWESGDVKPTLKQLEAYANFVRVPLGYLFLPEPPEERIPIPDLRTIRDEGFRYPSPDLLDTIYAMQRRQAWLREELIECGADPVELVGSARLRDDPEAVGQEMRRVIGFEKEWAAQVPTWTEAVGKLRRAVEELGIMAVINGIVGNNTHRKLNVEEFRGFALSDEYAPLIFVNGADAKSAQMFTLAHELAHIWLGQSALTNTGLIFRPSQRIESWCDRAAAEFLIPAWELKEYWREIRHEAMPFEAIARRFKVSPIVAGRRAMDLRLVGRKTFFEFYQEYTEQEYWRRPAGGGGDFYNNQNLRVGERFALHVIRAAKEGRLSFKEAYDLVGLRGGTFQEYASRLGVSLP
ncbi:MAG TPA: ImmA/IrrE family metallo-endopeptidase [candidate division WOR-3 bacterium]|uniref:ImmA/IrrE family metallo-endopeptidase n=1 Tax=candidate division WOR-3 bacterium TaxID=2052148 RepID=A0A9C9K0B3_UNCW3|nr:ImmA/IrrE family metallo-endopeptidase [candidate division WOR-3 bacterium]